MFQTTLDDTTTGASLSAGRAVYDYLTYVAARTTDATQFADQKYTQIAKTGWQVDLSGTVTSNTYNPSAAEAYDGDGVFAPPAEAGSVVPVTEPPTANDAAGSVTWTTGNDN